MSDYINRNPEEMKKSAAVMLKSVETMGEYLTMTRQKIAAHEGELDQKSRNAIEKLDKSIAELRRQVERYQTLANKLQRDADRIEKLNESFKI